MPANAVFLTYLLSLIHIYLQISPILHLLTSFSLFFNLLSLSLRKTHTFLIAFLHGLNVLFLRICFLNLQKALFDKPRRDKLINILNKSYEVDWIDRRPIKELYMNQKVSTGGRNNLY